MNEQEFKNATRWITVTYIILFAFSVLGGLRAFVGNPINFIDFVAFAILGYYVKHEQSWAATVALCYYGLSQASAYIGMMTIYGFPAFIMYPILPCFFMYVFWRGRKAIIAINAIDVHAIKVIEPTT